MVTLAMVAGGCGVKIFNEKIDPDNLNSWLGQNNGFNSDGTIDLKCLEKLSLTQSTETDINTTK